MQEHIILNSTINMSQVYEKILPKLIVGRYGQFVKHSS